MLLMVPYNMFLQYYEWFHTICSYNVINGSIQYVCLFWPNLVRALNIAVFRSSVFTHSCSRIRWWFDAVTIIKSYLDQTYFSSFFTHSHYKLTLPTRPAVALKWLALLMFFWK